MLIGLVGMDKVRESAEKKLRALSLEKTYLLRFDEQVASEFRFNIKHWFDEGRRNTGIILINTPGQAEIVRHQKGIIWHVLGKPSFDIPITDDDLMVVTTNPKATGRKLTVAEAFSESIKRVW